jgi:hypothetical protein
VVAAVLVKPRSVGPAREGERKDGNREGKEENRRRRCDVGEALRRRQMDDL